MSDPVNRLVRYRSAPSRLLSSFAQSVLEHEQLFSVPESPPLWLPPPLPPPAQIFSDTDGVCGSFSLQDHPQKSSTNLPSEIHKTNLDVGAYELLESCLDGISDTQEVGNSVSGIRWQQHERLPSMTNQAQNPAPILRASSLPAPTRPRAVVSMESATSPYLGPYQSRAKRGCATHPRSVAERVRRTRISEKIRKLQDLVPNMDKQLNTAEMLDEAVEYVKYLQQQVKELSRSCRGCCGDCKQDDSSRNMQRWYHTEKCSVLRRPFRPFDLPLSDHIFVNVRGEANLQLYIHTRVCAEVINLQH